MLSLCRHKSCDIKDIGRVQVDKAASLLAKQLNMIGWIRRQELIMLIRSASMPSCFAVLNSPIENAQSVPVSSIQIQLTIMRERDHSLSHYNIE